MLFREVILLESEAHSLFPRVRLLQLPDAMPRVEDRMRCSPTEKGRGREVKTKERPGE